MERDKIYENDFLKPIMYWGKRTLLLAVVISFAPPLYIYFAYGTIPTFSEVLKAFILVAPFYKGKKTSSSIGHSLLLQNGASMQIGEKQ